MAKKKDKPQPTVNSLWQSALEDAEPGGDTQRGLVKAIILHSMIVEVGVQKIVEALTENE